jgi:hypothetical protein
MKSMRIYASLFLVSDFLRNMNLLVSPRMNEYPEEFQEWRKPELINCLRVSLENAELAEHLRCEGVWGRNA